MALSERRKGIAGEREVAALWTAAGAEVRGLEGSGDHLVMFPGVGVIHSEVKRQERLQLPIWLRQAALETPQGVVPVVSFRQNRGRWYAALPLADLAALLGSRATP